MPSEPSPRASGSWRAAWALGEPAYTELAFQAIYAVRQGNLPPNLPAAELPRRARRRVTQSKVLVSALLGVLSLGSLLFLNTTIESLFVGVLPWGLYVACLLGALVVLEMTLVWWTGLQVLPAYLASGIVPLLQGLPVEPRLVRRTALILLLRLFDAPALTCLVLTPLAASIALGSVWAGLLLVPAVFAGLLFAIALALLTGRFFVRRVLGARGGWAPTAVRWAFLVLWAVPAFMMYGFLIIAPAFLQYVANLAFNGPASALNAVFLAFPFPLTALSAFATGLPVTGASAGLSPLVVVLGLGIYGGVVLLALDWLAGAPVRFGSEQPRLEAARGAAPLVLKTTGIAWAVLRKDVRTASRTPGFAFLILLPLLEAGALGIWTYVANPVPKDVFTLAWSAVGSAALLATFFGPAFFAVEVMGYSYTRSLPLPGRAVLLGKVTLVALIYAAASILVLALTLLRIFSPGLFLGFIVAEFPAVIAAALVEFSLLFHRARSKGLPITNLFSGGWWAILVALPGLVLAGAPLLLFIELHGSGLPAATPVLAMGAFALAELAASVPLALSTSRRGAV